MDRGEFLRITTGFPVKNGSQAGYGLILRNPFGSVATVIILLLFLAMILFSFRKSRKPVAADYRQAFNTIPPQRDDELTRRIQARDPAFARERFLEWAGQVFVRLQQAWTERDCKLARSFESEEIFALHRAQIESYIKSGTINVMENVCVIESYLCDYKADDKFEYLTVFMNTRYSDYVVKEDTKKIIRGDPGRTDQVQYTLKFMRALSAMTTGLSNKSTVYCPNCGAPIQFNESGRCEACSTIATGDCDWVLCELDDLSCCTG